MYEEILALFWVSLVSVVAGGRMLQRRRSIDGRESVLEKADCTEEEKSIELEVAEEEMSEEIKESLRLRQEARERKDWGVADDIREEIRKQGYKVEDTQAGTRLKKTKLSRASQRTLEKAIGTYGSGRF
ncbi:hypothetical protein MUP01_11280 [Candidatus Bathyarchaeota archaeon]|nr:hypothetical protein [Candidatus Bathyarchaeota archaeon]